MEDIVYLSHFILYSPSDIEMKVMQFSNPTLGFLTTEILQSMLKLPVSRVHLDSLIPDCPRGIVLKTYFLSVQEKLPQLQSSNQFQCAEALQFRPELKQTSCINSEPTDTVKSRYNGLEGKEKFYLLQRDFHYKGRLFMLIAFYGYRIMSTIGGFPL